MGIKLKSVKCINRCTIERPVAKEEFDWVVYNATSGYVVALTYTENLASIIVSGLNGQNSPFHDRYEYSEIVD